LTGRAGALVCAPNVSLPELALWQWIVGTVAAVLVGVAKTGVPGFGILAVPLMVLAVGDARHSAGWLLPLLCVADVFAVAIYRRRAYARSLLVLLPWVLVGMAAGALALDAPERVLRPTVAVIVVVMILFRWWRTRRHQTAVPHSLRHSIAYGGAAGFATTIANAAGPIMNLYLLAKRLPKDEFVGTGAWFFLIVNLCKLPVYIGHGFINGPSLAFDALLVPAVIAGAGLGRWLVRRMRQETFEVLVLALTILAAALLFVPRS
jgi:uncharacterized membrane protein YfcA